MNAAPPELYHLGREHWMDLERRSIFAWTVGIMRYKEALPILPHLIASFDAFQWRL